jgi:hypothetical protein
MISMTKEKAVELVKFLFMETVKNDMEPLRIEVIKNDCVGRRSFSAFISRSENDCPNPDARDVISSVGSTEQNALNNLYAELSRLIEDEFYHVNKTIGTLEFLLTENKSRLNKLQQIKKEIVP